MNTKVVWWEKGSPSCASAADVSRWAGGVELKTLPASFCTDCTPEHQASKLRAGRCENPQVVFRTDRDGFREGFVPVAPARAPSPARLLGELLVKFPGCREVDLAEFVVEETLSIERGPAATLKLKRSNEWLLAGA